MAVQALYLVTREDLPEGQQAVQAAHALQEFNMQHYIHAQKWHAASNTLAFLSVPNEEALQQLLSKAQGTYAPVSLFREPDRDNELTAIAIGPSPVSRGICRGLPLALRPKIYPASPEAVPVVPCTDLG